MIGLAVECHVARANGDGVNPPLSSLLWRCEIHPHRYPRTNLCSITQPPVIATARHGNTPAPEATQGGVRHLRAATRVVFTATPNLSSLPHFYLHIIISTPRGRVHCLCGSGHCFGTIVPGFRFLACYGNCSLNAARSQNARRTALNLQINLIRSSPTHSSYYEPHASFDCPSPLSQWL